MARPLNELTQHLHQLISPICENSEDSLSGQSLIITMKNIPTEVSQNKSFFSYNKENDHKSFLDSFKLPSTNNRLWKYAFIYSWFYYLNLKKCVFFFFQFLFLSFFFFLYVGFCLNVEQPYIIITKMSQILSSKIKEINSI